MNWEAPIRPIEHVEAALVRAILDGQYAAGSTLPGERELAQQLGVTRPTLREALRRLERDGWLTIQQGKQTRVNDFWREGGPNILTAIVRYSDQLPAGFITNLLEVRGVMAPAYIRAAVERDPEGVAALAAEGERLADEAAAYALFDWRLHHELTLRSGNPVYTLILNGFAGFYEQVAQRYFSRPEARAVSRSFYRTLASVAAARDTEAATTLARSVMQESIAQWRVAREER
ncbi:MAG: fatty acid metabolism transcriptional regulator FadR [Chloroflexi bacterium]|nr:fatty acid metabolism transcriptional regulator FadR [Chloroflexota bacterium]